jgi:hypothetical protein
VCLLTTSPQASNFHIPDCGFSYLTQVCVYYMYTVCACPVKWSNVTSVHEIVQIHHRYHKHIGLGHLARSVSRVTVALASVSSVSQLFSFVVDCSGLILKGFGVVAFFAGVRASSFCIHLFCLVGSAGLIIHRTN